MLIRRKAKKHNSKKERTRNNNGRNGSITRSKELITGKIHIFRKLVLKG